MGQTPSGKRPDKPGFLIIGTQNPVTLAGRRAPSTAFARRIISETVSPYSDSEMQDILMNKGMATNQAQALVNAFNKNLTYAQNNHLSPAPNFRNVLRLVAHIANTPIHTINAIEVTFKTCATPDEVNEHANSLLQQIRVLTGLAKQDTKKDQELLEQAITRKKQQIQQAKDEHLLCLHVLSSINFNPHLEIFAKKAKQMRDKVNQGHANYKTAVTAAEQLLINLNGAKKRFIQNDLSMVEFKGQCLNHGKEAKSVLTHHREWKGVLAKFVADIIAFFSTRLAKRLGFFGKTDSYVKLEQFEKEFKKINKIEF
jgi:hypothetical protein